MTGLEAYVNLHLQIEIMLAHRSIVICLDLKAFLISKLYFFTLFIKHYLVSK